MTWKDEKYDPTMSRDMGPKVTEPGVEKEVTRDAQREERLLRLFQKQKESLENKDGVVYYDPTTDKVKIGVNGVWADLVWTTTSTSTSSSTSTSTSTTA
jgi:hypothetical protein